MTLAAIRAVDYVVLLCDDPSAMLRFYRDVLGFAVRQQSPDWTELTIGSTTLALRPRGRGYDGPSVPDSAGVQLAFRVPPPDVGAWHQELLSKQVPILQPPQGGGAGHYTLFFADPEANVLEIYAET